MHQHSDRMDRQTPFVAMASEQEQLAMPKWNRMTLAQPLLFKMGNNSNHS